MIYSGGKGHTFGGKLSLFGDKLPLWRALGELWTNPPKNWPRLDPPPFWQCQHFGNIWSPNPSLTIIIRIFLLPIYIFASAFCAGNAFWRDRQSRHSWLIWQNWGSCRPAINPRRFLSAENCIDGWSCRRYSVIHLHIFRFILAWKGWRRKSIIWSKCKVENCVTAESNSLAEGFA